MHEFIESHLQAFYDDPFYLFLILIWMIWYVRYQRGAAALEPNLPQRQSHNRRVLVGVLTAISGVVFFPAIMIQNDAQHIKTQLEGNSTLAPVDSIDGKSDDYIYAVLGQMQKSPENRNKMTTQFTLYKNIMSLSVIDLKETKVYLKTEPTEAVGVLDLIKNVPYAAHGYVFPRASLRGFYQNFDWYKPTQSDAAAVEKTFNHNERANIANINQLQHDIYEGKN